MSKKPKKNHASASKAKVAVEGSQTKVAPAQQYQAHPNQFSLKFLNLSIVVLVLMLAAAHTAWFGASPIFPVDDAYITLHNAMALVKGADINYPGISALTGATSSIHLALVSFLMLFFPPLWALQIAAWLGVLFFALGTARLAYVWEAKLWQACLLVLLGLTLGRMPHQLMNGLETGLALAGLIWAIALASERSPRYPWLLPIVCGQLPFLRPELIVVSIVLPIAHCVQVWQDESSIAAAVRSLIRDILLLVASALPWLIWYLAATGSFYPSTISAKRLFFAEGCLPSELKINFISGNLWLLVQTLGVFSLSVLGLLISWPGRAGLIFFVALIAAYYTQFPGALGHYEQRYLYVCVPFLLLGAASAWRSRKRILPLLASSLVVIALVQSAFEFPSRWQYYQATRSFTEHELKGVAKWCLDNLAPESIILVHDIGYISYATPFRLIDFVGLKTPSSVRYHSQITWPTCGLQRAKAVSQIALEGHAQYLVMLRGWDSIFRITEILRILGWGLLPVRPDGEYNVYQLQPPRSTQN